MFLNICRWGPEIEEKPEAKSSLKLDASLAIKGGNDLSETELSGGGETVKEEDDEQGQDEDTEQGELEEKDEGKSKDLEKSKDEGKRKDDEKREDKKKEEGEEKGEGEKEQLDDIKKR